MTTAPSGDRQRTSSRAAGEPDLVIAPVEDKADLVAFVRVPWSLYDGDSNWVPPLVIERRQHFSAKSNPYYAHAEVQFWTARRGGRPVGRISAQVDRAYLERHQDATGHFGLIEAEDEAETFAALFAAAEDWLRGRGMRRATGPFSLSINDESGLLVDGFDTPPSLMMGHAPAYYGRRVEEQGYVKAKDLIAYDYDTAPPLPPPARAMVEKLAADSMLRCRRLNKKAYAEDLGIVLDIFNDAWSENWGFVPLSPEEVRHVGNELKILLREELVCIAEVGGEPAAMAVAVPNLNELIADLDGRLLPVGWAKLLWRLKVTGAKSARVMLMGVRRRYHGTPLAAGLAVAVIDAIRRGALEVGMTRAELSWVLEDNLPVRRLIESLGAEPYKTYRVYEKGLD